MAAQADLNQVLDNFVAETTPRIQTNMCEAILARMDFDKWCKITKNSIRDGTDCGHLCVQELRRQIRPTTALANKYRAAPLITISAHIDHYFAAAPDPEAIKKAMPQLEADDDPEIQELAAQYPLLAGQLARESTRWQALRNSELSPASIVDFVQRLEAGLLKTE